MKRKFKDWFYEFQHGHPECIESEFEIVKEVMDNELNFWMDTNTTVKLIQIKIKEMYKERFPNAKKWSFKK